MIKFIRYFFVLLIVLIVGWIAAYLISNPITIPPFLNATMMMVVPLLLGVFLASRLKASWQVYGIGVLTFIGAQVLHIPFNNQVLQPIVSNLGIDFTAGGQDLILFASIFGLSAGVFEETARYLVYRKWLTSEHSWREGLMFGAGHGGFEAMVLGAVTFYVFLQAIILRDLSPAGVTAMVGEEQTAATMAFINSYWSTPWYAALLGALERISSMAFHLSATILVLQAVRRGNILWYFGAVFWHAALNAFSFYSLQTWGAAITEGIIFGGALLSVAIIFLLRTGDPPAEELPKASPPSKPAQITRDTEPINPEKLEESRYD